MRPWRSRLVWFVTSWSSARCTKQPLARPAANALNRPGDRVGGPFRWYAPYHVYSAALQQAPMFAKYQHISGMTDAQRAWIAINGRRNAAHPKAIYRDPITVDDFLASPILSTPVRLLDCDVPIDGSTALILSHIDAARDGPHAVSRLEAIGSSMKYRNSWAQLDAYDIQPQPKVAEMM